jgi:hypothetical protein
MWRLLLRRRRQTWATARRRASWQVGAAVAISLLVGSLLIESSVETTAQSTAPGAPTNDPSYFPATGYRISQPALLSYFQRRGGVRSLGYPISNDFMLLGKRVQLFQRQALEVHNDDSVGSLNLLDPDFLPLTHFDGLNLPPPDANLIASAPSPLDPDYLGQAVAFVDQVVPDQWHGRDVNFHATFLSAVTCAEAFGPDEACDPALLPAFDLEIWGLPTSQPMADPNNNEFVYQRFQRGVMHYSASTGLTQGVLLGDWFKRVLMGSHVPPDAAQDLQGSAFLDQYAPNRPLGLARPDVLPATTLATAFSSDSLVAAQIVTPTETIPPGVVGTATSVALTATAIGATQVSLQTTQVAGTATALTALQSPTPATPAVPQTVAVPGAPAGPAVGAPTVPSSLEGTPTTIVGCAGDEQLWFTPRKPFIGTHVDISVTSQRRHDTHVMRLTGPIDPGTVTERSSIFGWTWTWTIVPTVEGFYNWTFYADGLRPCITSGFPSLVQVGSTPTSTTTPVPTVTQTPTNTTTPTPTPGAPSNISAPGSAACGTVFTIAGNNFGTPPSSAGTSVLLAGPEGTTPLTIVSGSNTSLLVQMPSTGLQAGPHTLTVQNNSGFSTTGTNNFNVPTSCLTGTGATVSTSPSAGGASIAAAVLAPAPATATSTPRPTGR